MNPRRRDGAVLIMPGQPREQGAWISVYASVLREDGKTRIWYDLVKPPGDGPYDHERRVCYAESEEDRGVTDRDPVVILFKGGRLPAWHQLNDQERSEFEQTHVELMLSIADQHVMTRLEGFRLIGPQGDWQRFWLIEFPAMEGAEAWIRAEMAPPYGLYGHYEYYLSRPLEHAPYSTWVTQPAPPIVRLAAEPHNIPELRIDPSSIVVLMFARYRPGAESLTPEERGDAQHTALMQDIAREHGLIRIEGFQLLSPQADWHRAWVIELPTWRAAEAWVEGEEALPHGMHAQRTIHLARKWAPEYFASWSK